MTSGSTAEDRIPSPSASARAAAAAGGGSGDYRDSAAAKLARGDTATGGGGGGGWRDEYFVAAAPAGAAAAVPGRRKTSVVLGVPTVPRPKGVNYLEQTLQAVLAQVDQQVRMDDQSRRIGCESEGIEICLEGCGGLAAYVRSWLWSNGSSLCAVRVL